MLHLTEKFTFLSCKKNNARYFLSYGPTQSISTIVMTRFRLVHTNFTDEFEFPAPERSKFKFHQLNSNCSPNFGPKFARPKSVHYSC